MGGRIGREVRWRGKRDAVREVRGTDGRRRLMEARIDGRREMEGPSVAYRVFALVLAAGEMAYIFNTT